MPEPELEIIENRKRDKKKKKEEKKIARNAYLFRFSIHSILTVFL